MLDFLSNSIHLVAITPDGPLTGRNFGTVAMECREI